MTGWTCQSFAPVIADLKEAAYARTGAFENIPYSPYEVFIAEFARSRGLDANLLRRANFEQTAGVNDPVDEEDKRRRHALAHAPFIEFSRLHPFDLRSRGQLRRKDVRNVMRTLSESGSIFANAHVEQVGFETGIRLSFDLGGVTANFEVRARAITYPVSHDYVVFHNMALDPPFLGGLSARSLFLDHHRMHIHDADGLLASMRTDEVYFRAILSHLKQRGNDLE